MINRDIFDELFVLELANNHWGDLQRGLRIVREFGTVVRYNNVRAAIKLQFRDVDNFIHKDFLDQANIRYIKKTLDTKLSREELAALVEAIRRTGCIRMATPFDEKSVDLCVELGIDIIKIAVSKLFYDEGFVLEMAKLSIVNIKIVAVFFADTTLDFGLLAMLQKAGFYGAMLDTQNKQKNLLEVQTKRTLRLFTQLCHQYNLKSGLAGSLRPQHIELLAKYNPTYIGFRGGVCENLVRNSTLSSSKVIEIRNMLHQNNKNKEKPQLILQLALHS